jgi:hypothetical protein
MGCERGGDVNTVNTAVLVCTYSEEEDYSIRTSQFNLVSHAYKERTPLLTNKSTAPLSEGEIPSMHDEIQKEDSFYNERDATPVFAEPNWWVFFSSCLFSITLLSIWQNAGKVAMSVPLEDDSNQVNV